MKNKQTPAEKFKNKSEALDNFFRNQLSSETKEALAKKSKRSALLDLIPDAPVEESETLPPRTGKQPNWKHLGLTDEHLASRADPKKMKGKAPSLLSESEEMNLSNGQDSSFSNGPSQKQSQQNSESKGPQQKLLVTVSSEPQDYWTGFLTDEQKSWKTSQWEKFLDQYSSTPFGNLSEKEVAQLNYARRFVRNERENKRREQRSRAMDDLFGAIDRGEDETVHADKLGLGKQPLLKPSEKKVQLALDNNTQIEVSPKLLDRELGQLPVDEQMKILVEKKNAREKAKVDEKPVISDDRSPRQVMWDEAERLARGEVGGPRIKDEEFKQYSYLMQAMINHCRKWVRWGQPVPKPENIIEIYWPFNPSDKVRDSTQQSNERREEILTRTLKWASKAAREATKTWPEEQAEKFIQRYKQDLKVLVDRNNPFGSESYRVVLATMKLHDAIERYATNWRTLPKKGDPDDLVHTKDEEFIKQCQYAALEFHKAHFDLPQNAKKPGPLETLDPNFVSYVRFCEDYNIEVGTMLHDLPEIAGA